MIFKAPYNLPHYIKPNSKDNKDKTCLCTCFLIIRCYFVDSTEHAYKVLINNWTIAHFPLTGMTTLQLLNHHGCPYDTQWYRGLSQQYLCGTQNKALIKMPKIWFCFQCDAVTLANREETDYLNENQTS